MIYDVLPLIAKLAGQYQCPNLVEYDDMFQAGLIAVNRAISGYDPKIAKWTTYATTYATNAFRTVYKHRKRQKNVFQKTMTDIIDEDEALQLADTNADNPLEMAEKSEYLHNAGRSLEAALRKLHSRDELVIRMRFGIAPYDRRHSLSEVGEKHNLSRERVRQITDRALWRLNRLLRDEESLQDG